MLGWMILFALLAIIEGVLALAVSDPPVSAKAASIFFSGLFLISLLTRVVRGRAR
jgi:hypothetical protein